MTPNQVLAIALSIVIAFIGGGIAGWRVTSWDYQAQETKAVEHALQVYKDNQAAVGAIDTKEVATQEDLTAENEQLKEQLYEETTKKHTVCQLSAGLLRVCHTASVSPAGISR